MKKATLKSDIWLNGYGVLKAGTRYPVEKANTRYAYLQLQPRLTARVKRSDIVLKYSAVFGRFVDMYYRYRFTRGDNTLFMHLFKTIVAKIGVLLSARVFQTDYKVRYI